MQNKQITMRLEKELFRRLKEEADEEMRSISGQIRYILNKNFRKREE